MNKPFPGFVLEKKAGEGLVLKRPGARASQVSVAIVRPGLYLSRPEAIRDAMRHLLDDLRMHRKTEV